MIGVAMISGTSQLWLAVMICAVGASAGSVFVTHGRRHDEMISQRAKNHTRPQPSCPIDRDAMITYSRSRSPRSR
jgi:hypothetical protein